MSDAFGRMLPFALVIALSPIPIVAVIAMLFSPRAIAYGVAFLVGWRGHARCGRGSPRTTPP